MLWASVAHAQSIDKQQALASHLDAYAKHPNPKVLLDIAQLLREMDWLADAANTYQRYLADPAADAERTIEIKDELAKLDQQLTVLTIRVSPRAAEVSIDGGPFVSVGTTLRTRVPPGAHLVRARKGGATTELSINGLEGETQEVLATIATDAASTPIPTPATLPSTNGPLPAIVEQAPDHVDGWLITGRQYSTSNGNGFQRQLLDGFGGPVKPALVPASDVEADGTVTVLDGERKLGWGVIGVMRIDGKGRGVAGGFGAVLAPLDRVELEVAALKAEDWGLYAGMRVRFSTGRLRPYAGGGMPLFFYTDETTMESAVALGLRASAGIELRLNRHVSVQADLGVEHFFNIRDALVHGKRPDETVFVPTVGVIGRL